LTAFLRNDCCQEEELLETLIMPDSLHRFEIVNGKQIALLVAPVLGFALALVAVAARWYTRSTKRVNSLTEDALCLAALVGMIYGLYPIA
jgi:hypothetical protein